VELVGRGGFEPPTNGLKVSARASRTPWIAVYHGVRGLVHTYGQKILSSRRVVQFDVAELTAVATIDRIAQNTTLARARFAGTPSSRFHRERALHGILDKATLRGTSSR
jgi:hypothetical protein